MFLQGMKVINTHNRSLGIGSISHVNLRNDEIQIYFPSLKGEQTYSADSTNIKRIIIRPIDQCEYLNDDEIIKGKVTNLVSNDPEELYVYRFKGENGLLLQLQEGQFDVLSGGYSKDPVLNLSNLRFGSGKLFDARINLLSSVEELHNKTKGLKSLLGARLRIYPHQAFVVGKVVRNPKRRFMLADEVGLGKTIEAGLIMHNLIHTGEVERIMILAPGSLTHQWFCEMYIKFGHTVFTFMNETRHSELGSDWIREKRVICSIHFLQTHEYEWELLVNEGTWDLLILDEAHQIKPEDQIGDLIRKISLKTKNVLVLSATPITGHEKRYLSVLSFLDPHIYNDMSLTEFQNRLELQEALSEMLIATEDAEPDGWLKKEWLEILPRDNYVEKMCNNFDTDKEVTNKLCQYIENYYKINSRIIRNRRQAGNIRMPERGVELYEYKPKNPEKSLYSELNILIEFYSRSVSKIPLQWISLIAHAVSSSPFTLIKWLEKRLEFIQDTSNFKIDKRSEFRTFDEFSFWRFPQCSEEENQIRRCLQKARYFADIWTTEANGKLMWLLDFLSKNEETDLHKYLLFSDFSETIIPLITLLRRQFGEDSIAEFHYGLSDEERDKQALLFAREEMCVLMVCDELGGEGRNFQFAKGIIHFDIPWQPFKVEQRIGRLDRLGRKEPVVSHIPVGEDCIDTAVVLVFRDALEIFSKSTSGLEFIFDEILETMTTALISGGVEKLKSVTCEVREKVLEEREKRATDLILDRSSYDPEVDTEYEQITEINEIGSDLRNAICRWANVNRISIRYNLFGKGTVSFKTRNGRLVLDGIHNDYIYGGTFDREIATSREDLIFFSLGHKLIDGLIESAKSDHVSSTTMIHRFTDKFSWKGFRVLVSVHVNYEKLKKQKGGSRFINDCEFIFPRQVFEKYVRIEKDELFIENDPGLIEYLFSKPLSNEIRNYREDELTGWDMKKWGKICKAAIECVFNEIKTELAPQLEELIFNETKRMKDESYFLETACNSIGPAALGLNESELNQEKIAKKTMIKALKPPDMEVLAIGYYNVGQSTD